MFTNFLKGYLSRAQIREYLGFILENGAEAIVECLDGGYYGAPIEKKIGGAISSVKEFHLKRSLGELPKLYQNLCVLVSDSNKPAMPEETAVVGVVYMSKIGRDYEGEPDLYEDSEYKGDIGDVVWVSSASWSSVELGNVNTGANHRLVVFWAPRD